MNSYKTLNVFLAEKRVGTLAIMKNYLVAFEYDREWIENGFSISPYSLPLEKGVFLPKSYDVFEGLFGIFSDSLPDGWGRLLVDRLLMKKKINPDEIDSLNRLAIVGTKGMGALEYRPEHLLESDYSTLSLDQIAMECARIFESQKSENLDEIFRMGGSSGGARPKVFYQIDGDEWIVKFPSSIDERDIGEQEYRYALCAQKCGIDISQVKLLPSKINSGYFAVKRFDRIFERKVHMVSVSALLETSHRIPNLDYHILMKLTMSLTQDYHEIEKLYRLMCFNVFAHNRDDHSKNFSFLYDGEKWHLSPAYDLTYSNSIGGEHATTVDGNGKDPGMEEILSVAKEIKLDQEKAKKWACNIRDCVYEELREYVNVL